MCCVVGTSSSSVALLADGVDYGSIIRFVTCLMFANNPKPAASDVVGNTVPGRHTSVSRSYMRDSEDRISLNWSSDSKLKTQLKVDLNSLSKSVHRDQITSSKPWQHSNNA